MEATLLIIPEENITKDLISLYNNKIQKILGKTKFKNISVWTFDSQQEYHRYHYFGQICGKKLNSVGEEEDNQVLNALVKLMINKASIKNPGFVRIYYIKSKEPDQKLIESLKNEKILSSSLFVEGLEDFFESEFQIVKFLEGEVEFSGITNPELLTMKGNMESMIEGSNTNRYSHYINGWCSSLQIKGQKQFQINCLNGEKWLLSVDGSKNEASICNISNKKDLCETFGFKISNYYPKLLSNPENEVLYQLYQVIRSMDEAKNFGKFELEKLSTLLDAFVSSANANEVSLFPKIHENNELRSRAISQALKELRKISINNPDLKKILDTKLSLFDRNKLKSKGPLKRPKLIDAETLNESAPAFAEFKKCIPYLDYSNSSVNQKDFPPQTVPKNSLSSVYWKLRNFFIEEPLLKGRKYWE